MTYDEFIDTAHADLPLEDREEVEELAMAVLKTFSELLYRTERDKLGAPLPKALDRALHAAKRQNNRRATDRFSVEEFLNRIEARTDQNLSREEARSYTSVVFEALTQATGRSLFAKVAEKLPPDYGSLFPSFENTEAT